MNDSSKYNSFGAADIERYYKGEMSAAERHALEKAALDDPFLADALEGYSFTPTPVADVDYIREKLESKLQKRKVFFLSKNNSWLRIAALFLVLAGSGWFLYRSDVFHKKEIAKASSQEHSDATVNKTVADTNQSSDQQSSVATETPKVETSTTTALSNRKEKKKTPVQKEINQEEVNSIAAASPAQIETSRTENASGGRSIKVTPENNDIALSAKAAAGNARMSPQNKNDISNATPDSVSASMAMKGAEVSNDTIKNVNVVMQPSKEEVNEVVVVGLGARKRAAARPSPKFEELEPAEGWNSFNDYIASHLKEPEEAKEKTFSGDVELSFEVNQEGQPTNIKVEKSLCSTCDEEAIRLLKEGPKWKKKKDKKGKVTIHF